MRPDDEEDDDGEELIGDAMLDDYRAMGALDQYEEDGLDGNEYEHMDPRSRAAADAALDARDGREQTSRMPAALLQSDDDEEDRPDRRRRREDRPEVDPLDPTAGLEELLGDDAQAGINLEDYNCALKDWIQTAAVSEEIKRRFKRFLTQFSPTAASETSSTQSRYAAKVRQMCAANSESLDVSYLHLSSDVPILAIWVADAPRETLSLLDEAAMEVVRIMFPDYHKIQTGIHVRITELPIQDSIRELRQVHMDCLVKVSGVVTRRSSVHPQLKVCKYNCGNCGYIVGPFSISGLEPKMAGTLCPSCQSKGPYTLNHEQTVYCNYQKVTLQESPGSVPPGRLPRHKEVVMTADLIDMVRPGEEIEVTGVYNTNFDASLNRKSGFPVFATLIEANHVQKKEDADRRALTEEDQRDILNLAKRPDIRKLIIGSIAPSIYGHEDIKTAIALSMFGGNPKDVNNKHRIRGDINVLLLGDPGTAKSQFLKYVEKTSPRAVYTTGQGASAVGLTASVHKDPVTREWTLEGGALVLADKGVCLIDEFDKMNDGDRTSIHEAMEQQSISIAKAGITASLQARCAVIAAANPKTGRYDGSVSFADNVDLTEPILSRFDCICVVRDKVDVIEDERLAEFVVDSHMRSHPHAEPKEAPKAQKDDIMDQALLRKYIMFARQNTKPTLAGIDQGKIISFYTELRKESASGGVSVAVRHIESIIRMSEASARMHLRDQVKDEDVNLAIEVLLRSVVKSQKFSVAREMKKKFAKYEVETTDPNQLIEFELRNLFRQASEFTMLRRGAALTQATTEVDIEEFEARARSVSKVDDLTAFFLSSNFASFCRARNAEGREVIIRATEQAAFKAACAAHAAAAAVQQQQQQA